MMRGQQLLHHSSRQTICVFCATRLGAEAGVPRRAPHGQRRHLQSSRAFRKPPAAAAAVQEEDERTDYQPAPRDKPRFGGGWARSSFSAGLTPEEERQRHTLLQAAQSERAAVERATQPRDSRNSQNYPGSTGYTFQTGSGNRAHDNDNDNVSTASTDYGLAQRPLTNKFRIRGSNDDGPRSPFKASRQPWDCPKCGYYNYSKRITCMNCTTLKPGSQNVQSRTEDGNVDNEHVAKIYTTLDISQTTTRTDDRPYNPQNTSTWQHVKRRYDHPTPSQDAGNVVRSVLSSPAVVDDRTLIEARHEREKQSKNGRFVGFGASGAPEVLRKNAGRVEPIPWDSGAAIEPKADIGTSPRPTAMDSSVTDDTEGSSKENEGTTVSGSWKRWTPLQSEDAAPKERSTASPRLNWWDQFPETTSAKDAVPETGSAPSRGLSWWDPSVGSTSATDAAPKTGSTILHDTGLAEETIDQDDRQARRDERRAKKFALDDVASVKTHDQVPEGRFRRRRHARSTYDEDEEDHSLRAERKRQRKHEKISQRAVAAPVPIYLPEFISVSNLATALKVKLEEFLYTMNSMGFEGLSNDHVLDGETAGLIAVEYNFDPIIDRSESQDLQARPPPEDKSLLPQRPPVVTIMGHVDHGKTTLLDWLRKSSVAASEHGGITQHIGAFSVPMPSGKVITFLDTPGHAAFLSMRQRGANVTDVVILVVAADDSVKPQTIEAIKHAKAATVPIIVAVNKIDKEDANAERVKQDLARHGVEVEDYGGDTQVVCVSGKTGQGMEELEEAVVALADILDMRAETDGPAEGWVLEATTKKAGRVATVLVRRGTMRLGNVIVAGSTWARIRSLRNEAGAQVESAGPGTPVEIAGWREQPIAGDEVIEATDEQKAKSVVELRLERNDRSKMAADMEAVNDSRRSEQEGREREKQIADGERVDGPEQQSGIKEVFFIVKGDVSGSVEAVLNSVSALGNEEVRAHILRSGVGPVTEFDVEHSAVAKGHIISFNTPIEANISRAAEAAGVSILDQNIIYRLVDDVKARLSEQLTPLKTQRVVGEADIAQVFEINSKGKTLIPIAGCKIRNGIVHRNAKVKVLRDKEVIYDGTLSSLKNVKKDVTEMRKGNECGLSFDNWQDFEVGDQIQSYEEKVEKRFL